MHKILIAIICLLAPFMALACNFHGGVGIQIPQHPNLLATLSNVARADSHVNQLVKPQAMLNWQLAQALNRTKPNFDITFYQVIEGHYSLVSSSQTRWLEAYPIDQIPGNDEAMILSELSVFNALLEKNISIDSALSQQLITINGSSEQKAQVREWLIDAFNAR